MKSHIKDGVLIGSRPTLTTYILDSLLIASKEFHTALAQIGTVLGLLASIGLDVNPQKTKVIISATRTMAAKTIAKITRGKGSKATIQLPSTTASPWIFPLVKSVTYFGACVSNGSFEKDTLETRVRHSRTAFARLRSWLTSAGLGFRVRFQLWKSCVLSIMTYGILAIGLPESCLHTIQQELYRQFRMICRDHAYVTRNTHQQALARLCCPPAIGLVAFVCGAALQDRDSKAPSCILQ